MDLITKVVILIALTGGLTAVLYFEVRYMRRRRQSKIDAQMVKDEAHNALVTTKALQGAVNREGYDTSKAGRLMIQAQSAYERGDFSKVQSLSDEARKIMKKVKEEETVETFEYDSETSSEEEETESPPFQEMEDMAHNFVESKFMIANVEHMIKQLPEGGDSRIEGTRLLNLAKTQFEAEEYTEALKFACQAKKWIEGLRDGNSSEELVEEEEDEEEPEEEMPDTSIEGNRCGNCGAKLAPDNLFCGKCGERVGPRKCSGCGTEAQVDDLFCRKCGTRIED